MTTTTEPISDGPVLPTEPADWCQQWIEGNQAEYALPASTVDVRIAVAINSNGEWCAFGDETLADWEAASVAESALDQWPVSIRWVTATIPITKEIKGVVSDELL
jgi:hypothetical protein